MDQDDFIDVHDGFRMRHTGGGCMAWELIHDQENEFEVWITDFDGVSMPDKTTEYVLVGFHLHDEKMHFQDGEPPTILQLQELTNGEHDLFNVNENYFSYGIPLKNASLERITQIVRNLSLDTFNKEVVLGLNTPKGDETQ